MFTHFFFLVFLYFYTYGRVYYLLPNFPYKQKSHVSEKSVCSALRVMYVVFVIYSLTHSLLSLSQTNFNYSLFILKKENIEVNLQCLRRRTTFIPHPNTELQTHSFLYSLPFSLLILFFWKCVF